MMEVKGLDQLSIHQPTAGFSDDEIVGLVTGWIVNNNAVELSRFLESSRSELVKSTKFDTYIETTNGTALHLAARHSSLDVLDVLLKYGLDANIADENGKTSAHWCGGVDELRVLLAYGASTLVPNKSKETLWHHMASQGNIKSLDFLAGLDVRQEALQMVSSRNETPICSALNNGQTDVVLFLLKHCDSRAFWQSGGSIFRAAAKLGSSEIVKHLLDVGIEVDGMDDITGNPLHYLSRDAGVECVQLLKDLFPLDQRRKRDHRTPLESLLLQGVEEGTELDDKVLEAMLPGNILSCPKEASRLWSFVGSLVAKHALAEHALPKHVLATQDYGVSWIWLSKFVPTLIELGVMAKHEDTGQSALGPFASCLVADITYRYEKMLDGLYIPGYTKWFWFSSMIQQAMREGGRWDRAGEVDGVRLLSFAILHNDAKMISLLVEKGVDMHSRVDVLSPFEFACFPGVPVEERSFAILVKHAALAKMAEGNEKLKGCGSLHFVAGWAKNEGPCTWKLRQMLSAGVNPNLPLSGEPSPLAFHVFRGALDTAEILLESGADPWARGSYSFDAALEAVRFGHYSILERIAATNGQTPCWDRTWAGVFSDKKFAGGNALHLAALNGKTKCLEFYLSRGLLSDLECCDDALKTPMHYAAHFDGSSTIELLTIRGGNIDARDRFGLTPLHLAGSQDLDQSWRQASTLQ